MRENNLIRALNVIIFQGLTIFFESGIFLFCLSGMNVSMGKFQEWRPFKEWLALRKCVEMSSTKLGFFLIS